MKILGYSLRNPFYKQKPNTRLHPDLKKMTEFAFHLEGYGDLYMFTNTVDMPHERFHKYGRFETEYRNRCSYDDFEMILNVILDAVNQGKMSEVAAKAELTKELLNASLDVDTMYRLASCLFFTEEEDLTDYDFDYNRYKIEAFKKQKVDDFFLNMPVSTMLGLQNISSKDLRAIETLTQVKRQFLQNWILSKNKSKLNMTEESSTEH